MAWGMGLLNNGRLTPRTAIAIVLFSHIVAAAAFYLLLFQSYDTNDDVAIRLITEGHAYPDSVPSPYVIFTNIAVGEVLSSLYRFAPGVPFYDVFEQGLLWLSSLTLSYVWLRRQLNLADVGLMLAVFLLFGAMLVRPQFTIAASVAALAGTLAIAFAPDRWNGRETGLLASLGTALLIVGATLRLEAAALGVMMLTVLAAIGATAAGQWPKVAPVLVPFAIAGFVTGMLWLVNAAAYAVSPPWSDFVDLNHLRGALQEYTLVPVTDHNVIQARDAAGWAPIEFRLFYVYWAPLDPDTLSAPRMRAFLAALPPMQQQLTRSWGVTASLLAGYWQYHWSLAVLVAALAATRLSRRGAVTVIGGALAFAGLVFAVSLLWKLVPSRLLLPMAAGALATLALLAAPRAPLGLRAAASLVGVAMALVIGLRVVAQSGEARVAHATIVRDVENFAQLDHPYAAIIGSGFSYEFAERPFHRLMFQTDIQGEGTGVYSWSPLARFNAHGAARGSLADRLCAHPAPYVITRAPVPDLLSDFYLEKRGQHVVLKQVFAGQSFSAFRCAQAP